jgi:DNA-directed RNA polymerase specialized sigma24 family protein
MTTRRFKRIVSLYKSGQSLESTAAHVGKSVSTVRYHLQRASVLLRSAGMPAKMPTSEQAAKLHRSGWSLPSIAMKFDVTVETIRKRLRAAGVETRRRGRPPKAFRLPVRELQLYLIRGWNIRAIARSLGISHETVRQRLVLVKHGLEPVGRTRKN